MHSVEKRRNTDFIKSFVRYSSTSEHGLDINAVLEVLHSFDMEDIQIAKDNFSSSVSEKYDTEEFINDYFDNNDNSGSKSTYVWKRPEMVRYIDGRKENGVFTTHIVKEIEKKYKDALEKGDLDEAEKWTSVLSGSGGYHGPYSVTPSLGTVRDIIKRTNR
tara:strand:+ start:970 stop:1452 length:483 start_codon:yes stop_codon:yes gene_type:complete